MRASILALACAVALVALYWTAILTPVGQAWDAASLGALRWFRGDGWLAIYGSRDALTFALLGLAAVAGIEAMVGRRWVSVVAVGALITLTALSSVLFKGGLLPRPDLGDFAYTHQTFPSGHTSISLAAAVAVIWFSPRWLNPILVVTMGALVGFIALASLLSSAHRASDIVGGALMVGTFAGCVVAVARPSPFERRSAHVAWIVVGLALFATGAAWFALSLAVLAVNGEGQIPWFIDSIGMSVALAVGGVVAVVLANQFPMRAAATQ